MALFPIILPVFALILTGVIFRACRLFSNETAKQLIHYVYYIAIPATVIETLSSYPLEKVWNSGFIGTYGLTTLFLFFLLILVFKIKKHPFNNAIFFSLNGTNTMCAFIGLPLLVALFGREGIFPATLSILVCVVLFSLAIFLLEIAKHSTKSKGAVFGKALGGFFKNPIVIGTLLGSLLSLLDLPLPQSIHGYLNFFELSLTPCALFAVGLQIDVKNLYHDFLETVLISIFKLILFPIIILILVWIFDLEPLWAVGAVLSAALPTAKGNAILCSAYIEDERMPNKVSQTITFTSFFSIFTLILWLIVLVHLFPGAFKGTVGLF